MFSVVGKHTRYIVIYKERSECSEWSRVWTTIHNLHAIRYYLWIVVDDTDAPELVIDISGIGWEHKIN